MSLEGATILVTGGTGQIGWGVAHAAQNAGARLLLTTSSARGREDLSNEFPQAVVAVVDLLDDDAADTITSTIETTRGRLDHVVAPIGAWWQRGATLEQPTTELTTLLNTYALTQHRLLTATAPHLGRARNGSYSMITGAAGAGIIPNAGMLVVAVRAQWALADVLRHELSEAPFRFNEIRIGTRVERDPRPGVVPSIEAGTAFLDVLTGDQRSRLVDWPSPTAVG